MKRVYGSLHKEIALEVANSKDGKRKKCIVKKNKIKLFGKKVNEWGVFCRK